MASGAGQSLSVVLPCYDEEAKVAHVALAAIRVCRQIEKRYEIIIVDDGIRECSPQRMDSTCSGGTFRHASGGSRLYEHSMSTHSTFARRLVKPSGSTPRGPGSWSAHFPGSNCSRVVDSIISCRINS